MKILDEKPFGYEYVCPSCDSRLQAEAEDVRVGYFGANYGGDTPERRYYVTCPVCGTIQKFDSHVLPPKVRELADQTEREEKR